MTDDTMFDLAPQARIVAQLVQGVTDEQLAGPTPCPDYAVRDLLGHLAGLSEAFGAAAGKRLGPATDTPPATSVPDLDPGWRSDLPKALDALAEAWRDPAAWTGTTRAGGVDLPGAVAAAVAVDELVVHGWDLARATGQSYDPDPVALHIAHTFLHGSVDDSGNGIFGPVVPVPADAPLLGRAVGLSGRDPGWTRRV
ncbi:TIGR03086 family protein [Streptomyces actuosus]|uniref:TIGR03086 family protein n=1 Tax=Streptomyces actuosus TaxID=1885 RepID=A0ABS2VLV1_STRAS|nr:TIGR03086 family metal-binding protein [Streptomyces actuosus]MBN0044083.1 TIGR03086 family protein [Streptomyces actuosus]